MSFLFAALLSSMPVMAGGVLFSPDSSLIDSDAAPQIKQIRAVLIREGEGSVVAMQAQVEGSGPVAAWVLPVHGGHVGTVKGIGDSHLERLLLATDPYYEGTIGCVGTGCSSSAADSGASALVDIREFGSRYQPAQVGVFDSNNLQPMLDELAYEGFVIDDKIRLQLADYAGQGWSFAVMRLQSTSTEEDATPLFAIRSQSADLVLPLALSHSTAVTEPLQVTALIIDEARRDPEVMQATGVTLGQPLFDPVLTPEFYEARVRVAMEEAGGQAWVLEYAGPLFGLADRLAAHESFDAGDPGKLLERMATKGLLENGTMDGRWITRWRTFLTRDQLVDERFVPVANSAYEVRILSSEYLSDSQRGGLPLVLLLPFCGFGWSLRRRRG